MSDRALRRFLLTDGQPAALNLFDRRSLPQIVAAAQRAIALCSQGLDAHRLEVAEGMTATAAQVVEGLDLGRFVAA